MKKRSLRKESILALLAAGTSLVATAPTRALAATGFGSRNAAPAPASVAPKPEVHSAVDLSAEAPTAVVPPGAPAPVNPLPARVAAISAVKAPEPPAGDDVEWIRVPFEKAENEVLALFQKDLLKVEERADDVVLYEVRATGMLPPDYQRNLKTKLERVLLTSRKLKVKECRGCGEARLLKTENGEMRYESYNSDPARPAKLASEVQADHIILAEMNYSPEDLVLRVRLVEPSSSVVRWSKEYSTADVVATREGGISTDTDRIGEGDSLSRVIIGEIAFTTVISPGMGIMPSIDTGGGTQLVPYPGLDVFIGEKFDRNRKVFGFQMGALVNLGTQVETGQALPWAFRVAPQFRYNFNPYNTKTARYSVSGEVGGFFSTGLTTGYVGAGPEVSMINRFSVSLTGMYILPGGVGGAENIVQAGDGSLSKTQGPDIGKFGGPAIMTKVNINW